MKKREWEIAKGELPSIYYDKVRFKDLSDSLLRDYRINGKKNLGKVETYVKTLTDFFGEVRVPEIATDRIEEGRGASESICNISLSY